MAWTHLPRSWWVRGELQALLVTVTLTLCVAVVWNTHYEMHDADSRLYTAMSADLAQVPPTQWCAPRWLGHWQREGLFFEHPPGMLWAGAALVRMGVPAFCALAVVNFVALFSSMWLLTRVGRYLGGQVLGMTAAIAWAVTPAFLQYLVRGDQEHPLTTAMLLGVFVLVVIQNPVVTSLLWAAALALGMFFKGLAGLALLPVAALYVSLCDRRFGRVIALAVGTGLAGFAALAFDIWYQQQTGVSFWQHYFAGQVASSVGAEWRLHQKLGNLLYYLARPLWFASPVLLLLILAWRHRGNQLQLWRARAWVLGWIVTAVFVLGFALADRKADRYIFPMYPMLALASAWLLLQSQHGWPARWARWLRRHLPWLPYGLMAGIWIGVCAKVYLGTYHYTFIRLWAGV